MNEVTMYSGRESKEGGLLIDLTEYLQRMTSLIEVMKLRAEVSNSIHVIRSPTSLVQLRNVNLSALPISVWPIPTGDQPTTFCTYQQPPYRLQPVGCGLLKVEWSQPIALQGYHSLLIKHCESFSTHFVCFQCAHLRRLELVEVWNFTKSVWFAVYPAGTQYRIHLSFKNQQLWSWSKIKFHFRSAPLRLSTQSLKHILDDVPICFTRQGPRFFFSFCFGFFLFLSLTNHCSSTDS